MARFFQSLFFLLVFSPPSPERFFARLPFEQAARPPDRRGRERLEDDVVVLFVNDSASSLTDFEILSQPLWNDHLPFRRE
jgi:hypothetical protein